MASRKFENWLQAFVQHTAVSESPDSFHFWTGVSTVAGALRRRVWIDMGRFQWTPNFYIILVGPPGIVAKSTTIKEGMRLLSHVPGVNLGPVSMTWQALTIKLEEALESVKVEDGKPLIMSCLTVPISELGTFLKPKETDMIDVLVDLWDGELREWGHSTKTTGETKIINPWINIIGATTPAWLKQNFPEHLVGGGLTSRIIFVFGDTKKQLIPYPSRITPSSEYRKQAELLTQDLAEISKLKGEFTLTDEAYELGEQWYMVHWADRPDNKLASDRYAGYRARKQTHIHKLAMILSACKRSDLTITRQDLEEAITLIDSVEPFMYKVFENIGVSATSKFSNELLSIVRAYKRIDHIKAYQMLFNLMSQKEFLEAVKACIDAGYIRVVSENSRKILVYSQHLKEIKKEG